MSMRIHKNGEREIHPPTTKEFHLGSFNKQNRKQKGSPSARRPS